MAFIIIREEDVLKLGVSGVHTATDFEVALDRDFVQSIDKNYDERVNLYEWHTPLPRLDGKGFYKDMDIIYARVRMWYGTCTNTGWLVLSDDQKR